MPKKLVIEQASNGFIVNENPDVSARCTALITEPYVFNNIHDMYAWMSDFFKEEKTGEHHEK